MTTSKKKEIIILGIFLTTCNILVANQNLCIFFLSAVHAMAATDLPLELWLNVMSELGSSVTGFSGCRGPYRYGGAQRYGTTASTVR